MHKYLVRLFEFDGRYGGGGTGVVAVEVGVRSEIEDNWFLRRGCLDECVNVLFYLTKLWGVWTNKCERQNCPNT